MCRTTEFGICYPVNNVNWFTLAEQEDRKQERDKVAAGKSLDCISRSATFLEVFLFSFDGIEKKELVLLRFGRLSSLYFTKWFTCMP